MTAVCRVPFAKSFGGKPRSGAAAIAPSSMAANHARDRHGIQLGEGWRLLSGGV